MATVPSYYSNQTTAPAATTTAATTGGLSGLMNTALTNAAAQVPTTTTSASTTAQDTTGDALVDAPSNDWVIQNRDPVEAPTTAPIGDYTTAMDASLAAATDPNSILNQRAYQSGLDMANKRGLLNSSMAANSAYGSVLDKAVPIAQSSYQGWLGSKNAGESAKQQNWLSSEAYNRDYIGTLAALPIKSYYDSLNGLMQAAIDDPTIMTPEAMSGFAGFFQALNMDMLNNFRYEDGSSLSGTGG